MKFFTQLAISGLVAASFSVAAAPLSEDRPDHFEGKSSETLEQAMSNLAEYNAKLHDMLASGDLTPKQMGEIHQLTYTLEEALAKLKDEVETMQEQVETVHLGSEKMSYDEVKETGKAYLNKAAKIVNQ
ncbi:DUF6746 family protein [Pseudidiomarina sp.]|uniref:DUF6746 family protein n=1 Tax=Pseudidiomarina sp. TaxID=2081707 RepID=UPI00299D8132|nr:DUF6746 family protein [Pseudidiomarina sp.]MDX1706853.1 DUF6746 family protein [Pseudidiomarina sp.]